MKILNFGSMNIDYVYQVDHFIRPGETFASLSMAAFNKGGRDIYIMGTGGTLYARMKDDYITHFDFKTGRRQYKGDFLKFDEKDILVIEGIHCLNDALSAQLPEESKFKIYISALTMLNLDNHNRIPTSYLRLLRRIVRDFESRGTSVQRTIAMWDSVRRGEKRWIFPYQENADVIFNSSTLYELAVLKKHIYPLLTAVGPEDECYEEVRNMVKILD